MVVEIMLKGLKLVSEYADLSTDQTHPEIEKIQNGICSWFELYMVETPEDRLSHLEAHVIYRPTPHSSNYGTDNSK